MCRLFLRVRTYTVFAVDLLEVPFQNCMLLFVLELIKKREILMTKADLLYWGDAFSHKQSESLVKLVIMVDKRGEKL